MNPNRIQEAEEGAVDALLGQLAVDEDLVRRLLRKLWEVRCFSLAELSQIVQPNTDPSA